MNIAIYGTGYVGLITAVCLAKLGHHVINIDINQERIRLLQQGICPIYEEKLPELLREQQNIGCLTFACAVQDSAWVDVHIIATGTPSRADGTADLSQVFSALDTILQNTQRSCLLVVKSTVPVGTGDRIQSLVNEHISDTKKQCTIDVAANPEFLREGKAIDDFLQADRIILGGSDEAISILKKLYEPLVQQGVPLVTMSRVSAELTKYAANAMLASRISFMNEISRLAEKIGADIDEVRDGMGMDIRIGPHFLLAGLGYGGSCFPKDVEALTHSMRLYGCASNMLSAIQESNALQKMWVIDTLNAHFKQNLLGKKIGIWGLSFKPGTDDLREASSLVVINELLSAKAELYLYDPVAMPAAQVVLQNKESIVWCDSAVSVLEQQLDALIIVTEWEEFKEFPLTKLGNALSNAPIIDGRNCFALTDIKQNNIAYYYSVGRPSIHRH